MVSNMKSLLSLDDIRYICNKFFGMLKIPVYFFDHNRDILFDFCYEYCQNPLYRDNLQLLDELNINDRKSLLYIKSTKFYENYFLIRVNTCDDFSGTILVGPTISSEIDEKSIDLFIRDFNILAKHREKLMKYYKNVVIIDLNRFTDASLLLYYSIYNHRLDVYDFLKNQQIYVDIELENKNNFDISQSIKRRDNVFHHPPAYEKELLNYVKKGNLDKLNEFIKKNITIGEKGIHAKNPLRNAKNLFISFTSLVSHAAFDGGLDWELALNLSDFYIQTVEELNTVADIYDLFAKMFLDYTERVRKIKAGNYSTAVVKSQNYIYEHLYGKISLSDLADHSAMNPSYLSHLFKKEVGLSISEYIQKERIEESKRLIEAGEKSLSDIYVCLGFIDQSHFSKAFKKVVGITPKEYRLLYSSDRKA